MMGTGWSPSPALLLPLFLVGLPRSAAAPSQGLSVSRRSCSSSFYDEALRRCCYRCPTGYKPKTDCPADRRSGCIKVPCKPDHYLNNRLATPQCEACVSCSAERRLVEKSPCTANSSRMCECQPGWYCRTPVENTCYRCAPHSPCKPGSGVKTIGNSVNDTVCEKCPPGTFSDLNSSTQICKPNSKNSEKQKNLSWHDGDLAVVGVLSAFALFVGVVMLWRRRSCKEWIVPHKANISNHVKMCAKRIEVLSFAESGPGESEPMKSGPLAGTESALSLEPDGGELVPLEPSLRNCANNHIEKVYIMRAETVIVGSVSEVPSGKACPARDEEESFGTREGIEVTELAMHYPEQETEFCPGSDITTPVEEEWEFHQSTEKMLVI